MSNPPDPFLLSILSQGVVFLFNEADKILEERRSLRQKRGEKEEVTQSRPKSTHQTKTSSKEVLLPGDLRNLHPRILSLRDVPQEIKHYLAQIHQYRENIRQLDAQAAAYGGFIYAPLITQNQIKYAEQEIYDNCQKLKHLVEEVYDRELIIEGLD